jgi:excisionase family DNA binding protein
MHMNAKLALSIEEAARLAPIGRTNIFRAIREGKLLARKAGRRTVILRPDLGQFLNNLPAARGIRTEDVAA